MRVFGQSIPTDVEDSYGASLQKETNYRTSLVNFYNVPKYNQTIYASFQCIRKRFPFKIKHMRGI